jgi:hypothetical protein
MFGNRIELTAALAGLALMRGSVTLPERLQLFRSLDNKIRLQLGPLLSHHRRMALKGPTTNHIEIKEWADSQGIVAVNIEPQRRDSEPARMSLLHKMTADETAFVRVMSWEVCADRSGNCNRSCRPLSQGVE